MLTVPTSFCPRRRSAAARCAEDAGFRVAQVVSEPAAALLAHGLGSGHSDGAGDGRHAVVYRAGGRSVSCAVVELLGQGIVRVVGSAQSMRVGGERVTERLADFLANEFQRSARQWSFS